MNWRLWTSLFALTGALLAQTSNDHGRTFWDNLFRNGQISFNREASKLLQYAVNGRRPGAAIDLGMGEGRNAVFLASKGWRVTGVDFSAEAVKQAKSRAAAAHVAPYPPLLLRRPHLQFVHAEIVRHFVPNRVGHQPRQILGTPRQPLVRTLKNRNLIGHRERLEHAPLSQRASLIQAQQGVPAGHMAARQLRRPGSGSTISATFFRRLRKRAGMRA
jgi:hypothetical protein